MAEIVRIVSQIQRSSFSSGCRVISHTAFTALLILSQEQHVPLTDGKFGPLRNSLNDSGKSHFHNHITGVILKRTLPCSAFILNTVISAEG